MLSATSRRIFMEKVMRIEYPAELLLGLHVNIERLADMVKLEAAVALFKKGKISSGMAAKWLDMPRAVILVQAMEQGAALLEDSADDFRRETQPL
jgi:predicted HTH domain antitoxin